MAKDLCTESPFELFKMAEIDCITIVDVLASDKYYHAEDKYPLICNLANQAVEKFLKGFIKNNNQTVEKTHNIQYLQNYAERIDLSFTNLRNECLQVYDFSSGVRYSSETPIEKIDIVNIIASLKIIYNFPNIKQLRTEFAQKDCYSQPAGSKMYPIDFVEFANESKE